MAALTTMRRYAQGFTEPKESRKPWLYGAESPGGLISYDLKIEGSALGLSEEQTEIVVQSVVNGLRRIMFQGKQTEAIQVETYKRRLPYLQTLLALTEIDKETLDLLMEV